MTTNSALDAVMDQAAAAAATAPTSLPANVPPQGTAVAQAPVGGNALGRPSLDDMADNAGIQVDHYLQFKDAGIKIDKGAYFTEFTAELDLAEVAPIYSVRANRGGKTDFIKSYDGITESRGQNFQQAIAHMQATYDKVDGPYQTVEIPLTLLEAVPGAEEGDRVGITPPLTGVKFWTSFYKSLRDRGIRGTIKVRVKHKYQSNRNGNEWGVAEFELIEG